MTIERAIFAFAGIMVALSVILTQFEHPNFYWFTLLIAANLFQTAFTGFCPAVKAMEKMGMKHKD
jgi:hypothetical protein